MEKEGRVWKRNESILKSFIECTSAQEILYTIITFLYFLETALIDAYNARL